MSFLRSKKNAATGNLPAQSGNKAVVGPPSSSRWATTWEVLLRMDQRAKVNRIGGKGQY